MSEINLKDVQQKLYEKLKPSGWDKLLRSFILRNLMQETTLHQSSRTYSEHLKNARMIS
jgi:hypothetical protein